MLNIPAGWKPIESAPKTGRTLLLGYWNSHGKWRTVRGQWMSAEYIGQEWDEPDGVEAGWFETAVEADDVPNCWPVTPSHWQPMPAPPCLTCNDQGAVGNILTAEPCPDCSPPSVAPGDAQDEQTESILWWIMRQAQEAKEPCGDDPESPAAVRNAKLAGIGGAAAQALGLVRGPDYPAPAAGDAQDAARWRFVRRKLCLTGNGDGTCAMQAINLPASIPGWPEPGSAVAEFCDAAIDAAIEAQRKGDA
ncbi:MAG TPA: hypothetical protein VNQ97_13975 [Burkholderiaceae bacterium]|nr:hypothetical protein [Burkholderiaceae bacterium]